MTTFTVIVPTFARPAQLAACLDSLTRLDAPVGGWELVVVDDGSPDGVEQVVDAWDCDGVDLRLVVQANAGPAAARNRGADEAGGTFLAFTDDDCKPNPGWLIGLEACLDDAPAALVGGVTMPGSDDVWLTASELMIEFIRDRSRSDGPTVLPSNNLACRTDRFRDIGGFDSTFPGAAGEDREFSHRWSQRGGDLRTCHEAVVRHGHTAGFASFWRQHHGSGRGAVRFRQRTANVERPVGVGFVAAMITHPLRSDSFDAPLRRRVGLTACVALSQLAIVTGVLAERLALRRQSAGRSTSNWKTSR